MNARFVVASLFALNSVSVIAGVIRHDVDDSLYRQLSYSEQFDSVGDIIFSTGTSNFRCSGTVIAANWVLTAAHCVDSAVSMTFRLPQFNDDRTELLGHTNYSASSWVWHENWPGSNLLEGWDVGLMYFENPFDVNPAKLYTGSSETGAIVTHVGYGATGTGLTGALQPSGTRRAGHNIVDNLFSFAGTGQQILWSDFDHPDPTATNRNGVVHNDAWNNLWTGPISENRALPLEYAIAGGDSGGGAFIEENGEWFLAGVHSFGYNVNGGPQSEYGDAFGSVRVSDFYDWIQSYTATAVPTPATLALFGFGLTLLWVRRRRS